MSMSIASLGGMPGVHPPRRGLLAFGIVLAGLLAAGVAPREAAAQFVCDSTALGEGGDGATALNPGDVACGTNAAASGIQSSAYGAGSSASGVNSSAFGFSSTRERHQQLGLWRQ